MNEKDTMKNSRKTNVKSNTSDIEAKEKKEQQEQEKILAAKYLIELIRSVLEERKPQPKPEQISMKCLFLTAKKHNLACMAYDAAKQIAGEEDKEVMEAWQNYSRTCMIMSAVQGKEGERLLERFSDNQVRVLPLKGWIMRRFYPKPEYRQMTDLDFLIDEENRKAVKQIMTDQERYQFQHIENENTVDSYQKDPWMHVEIHFANARVAAKRGGTVICCTRYGNVMCSRGSVIPLFIDQIKNKKPITVTDPNMTRFLMNLDEAVDLVRFAFEHANPGDLFIQKADASTIGDLAKAVQKLFGDTGINVIGTRHGEKLYETLMTREERLRSEDMGGYYRVAADSRDLNYDKFVVHGEVHTMADESYTSHNTNRLDVEGTINKILTTDYVKEELKGIRHN